MNPRARHDSARRGSQIASVISHRLIGLSLRSATAGSIYSSDANCGDGDGAVLASCRMAIGRAPNTKRNSHNGESHRTRFEDEILKQ